MRDGSSGLNNLRFFQLQKGPYLDPVLCSQTFVEDAALVVGKTRRRSQDETEQIIQTQGGCNLANV